MVFLSDLHAYDLAAHHRILVIDSGTILDAGVMSLIKSRTDMEVSRVGVEGEDDLTREIASFCPEVLVLNRSGFLKPERVVHLLDTIPTMQKLRLIILQTGDNSIEIYDWERCIPKNGDAVVALLQGNHICE